MDTTNDIIARMARIINDHALDGLTDTLALVFLVALGFRAADVARFYDEAARLAATWRQTGVTRNEHPMRPVSGYHVG
jgi:hypothetical protein